MSAYEQLRALLKRLEQLGEDTAYEARQAMIHAANLEREREQARLRMRDV